MNMFLFGRIIFSVNPTSGTRKQVVILRSRMNYGTVNRKGFMGEDGFTF